MRAFRLPILLAVALSLIASPRALAADTIGAAYGHSGGIGCPAGTYVQSASESNRYAAPYDGVITSWTNEDFAWQMKFKVVRLGSGSSFTVIGHDGPHPQEQFADNTNPVRIRVRQGDVIGYHTTATSCPYDLGAADTYSHSSADLAPGQSGSFESSVGTSSLPIEATIERDRDADGYGDETQDQCPTNAGTQGPCPLPTTLGETFGPFSNTCHAPFTAVVAASPGVVSAAPHDGVITAWSHQGGLGHTVSGQIRLKTFRPLGGADYTVVGESQPQTAVAMTHNTYAARVPVRQGDRIGVGVSGGQVSCGSGPAPTEHVRGFVDAEVPLGSSATFSLGTSKVDVGAVLEADADGDGFGDTSQDLCPSDASTQGVCPTAEPPDDGKCEQAKKKLAKAKAKLKKLKRNGAAAKTVKQAKKKVKKAKAAVKKRC